MDEIPGVGGSAMTAESSRTVGARVGDGVEDEEEAVKMRGEEADSIKYHPLYSPLSSSYIAVTSLAENGSKISQLQERITRVWRKKSSM
jgi:hypothetical protein